MFDLQQVIADTALEPFDFTGPDGEPCQLPHVKSLTAAQGLRVFIGGELREVLEEVAPEVSAMMMKLPSFAADALTREWLSHGGIELDAKGNAAGGKSSGSSRSSRSTAAPSKRTSRSGASPKSRR